MKKITKFTLLSLSSIVSLTALTHNAYATSYQIFADLNFANAAALNSVKQAEFIVGGATLFQRFHFSGTALGVPGSTTSYTTDELPYGRLAARLSPKVVVSLDITEPYFTDIEYPPNSFLNVFSVSTYIQDVNYSPKISYQVNERLALGAGLDFNHLYNAQLNFVVPGFGQMINKASSWGTGWDVGLFYVITPATYLNLSYYSLIVQHAQGTSTLGPLATKSSADVKLPATTIANVIQMLSPVWALSATIRYAQWNTVRYTVIQNTPLGTVVIPAHLYNNISTELATHYQINNKWGVLAAIDFEPNVQPTYTRNPGLPTYTRVVPAIGADYELTKGVKAKLVYAHAFSKPPINMNIAPGVHIQGSERMNVDVWDFSITYDI